MERSSVVVALLVAVVLLSGCTGLSSSPGDSTTAPPPTTESPTPTPAPTPTSTPTPTATTSPQTTAIQTPTPTDAWSLPEYPNMPFDYKMDEAGDHIDSLSVSGGTGSPDTGYSTVDVTITANTSLEGIDPASHGTVAGEPFMIAYIDTELRQKPNSSRYTVTGPPIQRSPELGFDEDATVTLTVPQAAFEARGTEPGNTSIMVLMFDRDKTFDDIYGHARVNLTYNPDA